MYPRPTFTVLAALALIGSGSCIGLHLTPVMKELERYVNDTLIVNCQGPGAKNVSWKTPAGQVVSSKGRVHVEERSEGNDTSLTLFFEGITRQDKGNYTCYANIADQSEKQTFTLTVVTPISFQGTPQEQNATEGQNFVLRCAVSGDPPPTVAWHFKGRLLNGGRYLTMPAGLHISNVTHDDAGDYQCRAYQTASQISNVELEAIKLNVLHKPYWADGWRNTTEIRYGFVGSLANLSCEAVGYPEPEYSWTRDNGTFVHEANDTFLVFDEDQGSYLQFTVENITYFGEYECTAKNSIGEIRRTIELRRGVKPASPKHVAILGAGATTASINITMPVPKIPQSQEEEDEQTLPVTGFRIQFKAVVTPDGPHTWEDPLFLDLNADSESGDAYTLSGLDENTNYMVRVAARNMAGLGDYSKDLSLRTKGPVSEPSRGPLLLSSAFAVLTLVFINFFSMMAHQ